MIINLFLEWDAVCIGRYEPTFRKKLLPSRQGTTAAVLIRKRLANVYQSTRCQTIKIAQKVILLTCIR
jgi:hypothetical protein